MISTLETEAKGLISRPAQAMQQEPTSRIKRVRKKAQQVNVPATKLGDLSLIPETYREKRRLQIVL